MQHSLVAAARPVIQPVSGGKLITDQRFGRPQRDLAKTGIARELPPGQKHRVIEQRTPLRRLNPVHETALVNVVKIVEHSRQRLFPVGFIKRVALEFAYEFFGFKNIISH